MWGFLVKLPLATKIGVGAVTFLVATLFTILLQPAPLFAHSFHYGQFAVRSDRPIEFGWENILADVEKRLATSDFYDANARFRIFVCNDPWRLWFLTRSTQVGGFADTFMTRNIYLRELVPDENRIVPPSGTLADADVRPLSYFIAHEAVHVMQSRTFGRLVSLRSPRWLVEGHADLVAKAGEFDFEDNTRRLIEGDPLLSDAYARRGLYRRYHLMVKHETRGSGTSIQGLFASSPKAEDVIEQLLSSEPDTNGR